MKDFENPIRREILVADVLENMTTEEKLLKFLTGDFIDFWKIVINAIMDGIQASYGLKKHKRKKLFKIKDKEQKSDEQPVIDTVYIAGKTIIVRSAK